MNTLTNKPLVLCHSLIVFFLLVCCYTPIQAQQNQLERELIIRFAPDVPQNEIDLIQQSYNATEVDITPLSGFRLWRLDSTFQVAGNTLFLVDGDTLDIQQSGDKARDKLEVESADINGLTEFLPGTEGDSSTCSANAITAGTCDVTVAIIDTGIDSAHYFHQGWHWFNSGESFNHTDTDNNGFVDDLIGYDFYNNQSSPIDLHGHGTHVAGIIVDMANTAGANSIKTMHLKAINKSGRGSVFAAIKAIDYAIMNGADIINFSLGYRSTRASSSGATKQEPLEFAINKAGEHNILVVCSAGNDNTDIDASSTHFYPAEFTCPNLISVAAADCSNNQLSSYSNYGNVSVDMAAPGLKYSTLPGDLWGYKDGTSMAAAVVTGNAAILATHCGYGYAAIKEALIQSIDPADLPVLSEGIVNGQDALDYLINGGIAPRKAAPNQLAAGNLLVWPNPSVGPFFMKWMDQKERPAQILIHNAQGQEVFSSTVQSNIGLNQIECPFSTSQSGIFLLTLVLEEEIITERIIRP